VSYPFPEGKHENPEKIQRVRIGKMTVNQKASFLFAIYIAVALATLLFLAVAFVVGR